MGFCENQNGISIIDIHPNKMCFQSNVGSFFRFDIYRFVGGIGNPTKKGRAISDPA
jgi:hypothetical protein